MGATAANIVLLFLVLIGTVTVFQKISLRLLSIGKNREVVLLLPVGENERELEMVLRTANMRMKNFGKGFCKKIVVLDCGMDAESRKICEACCRDYPALTVCRERESEYFLNRANTQK